MHRRRPSPRRSLSARPPGRIATSRNRSHRTRTASEQPTAEPTPQQLTRDEQIRILRWLLLRVIVPGVIGNAVYDLLKTLAKAAGQHIDDLLPDTSIKSANFLTPTLKIDWCRVPAGTFLMGSSDRDPDAYSDEKPQHRLYLPTFHIAKYPITNAQYATFIRATNHDPQPNYWQNNTFPRNQGNHPVRSVNCHEAIAFCEWAALVTRRPIRLPTEAEWEKAARGRDGRIYPWGNRWEPNRCNADSRYKSTTPVDQFPRGQSPYGVLDMIGNVWEWTSTAYADYPYDPHDGRENIQDTDKSHVRRGGAWWNSPRGARAASRGRYWDGNWPNLGFRVCVATPFS